MEKGEKYKSYSFNPCSVGLSPETDVAVDVPRRNDQFQSLFCWIIP